jgi:hypothetical protein
VKIAFDVDGVVLRSIDVILEAINRDTGRNLNTEDLSSWDLEPLGIDHEILKQAVDYMYSQPQIEPYDGAMEALSLIHSASGEPLLFITGRSDPTSAKRQLLALPWKNNVPEIIVTGGDRNKIKHLHHTGADFILEDDPKHLHEYLIAGIKVGLMLQPWNRNSRIPVSFRFRQWADVAKWYSEDGSRA